MAQRFVFEHDNLRLRFRAPGENIDVRRRAELRASRVAPLPGTGSAHQLTQPELESLAAPIHGDALVAQHFGGEEKLGWEVDDKRVVDEVAEGLAARQGRDDHQRVRIEGELHEWAA